MPPKKKPPSKHVAKTFKNAEFRQKQQADSENLQNEEFPTMEEFQGANFAKRKLTSNWDKYDKPIESAEENAIVNDRDFSFLLKQSNSDGLHHFQLAAEKEWEANKNNSISGSSLFSLDLNILSQGLSCIPFHEMIGVEESQLLPATVEAFREKAVKNMQKYNAHYRPDQVEKSSSKNSSVDSNPSPPPAASKTQETDVAVTATANVKICDEDDDDLEDWLDSVLDK